jgi:low temperature requirement protein LtrA
MALTAYFYSYIPMLLGIITAAAGVRLVFGHVMTHPSVGPAVLLGGGVGVYLAGNVAFRLSLRMQPTLSRAVGAFIGVASIPLGVSLGAVAQLTALAFLIIAVVAVEPGPATEARGAGGP